MIMVLTLRAQNLVASGALSSEIMALNIKIRAKHVKDIRFSLLSDHRCRSKLTPTIHTPTWLPYMTLSGSGGLRAEK